jgi:hypothetical protein
VRSSSLAAAGINITNTTTHPQHRRALIDLLSYSQSYPLYLPRTNTPRRTLSLSPCYGEFGFRWNLRAVILMRCVG